MNWWWLPCSFYSDTHLHISEASYCSTHYWLPLAVCCRSRTGLVASGCFSPHSSAFCRLHMWVVVVLGIDLFFFFLGQISCWWYGILELFLNLWCNFPLEGSMLGFPWFLLVFFPVCLFFLWSHFLPLLSDFSYDTFSGMDSSMYGLLFFLPLHLLGWRFSCMSPLIWLIFELMTCFGVDACLDLLWSFGPEVVLSWLCMQDSILYAVHLHPFGIYCLIGLCRA